MILKNRHEKTTGRRLDTDLVVTLLMQKTTGPLQHHLLLNVRGITKFLEALEIVYSLYSFIKSRHPTVPSGRNDHHDQAAMDVGALKAMKGWKGKSKEKAKDKDVFCVVTQTTGAKTARKGERVECPQ